MRPSEGAMRNRQFEIEEKRRKVQDIEQMIQLRREIEAMPVLDIRDQQAKQRKLAQADAHLPFQFLRGQPLLRLGLGGTQQALGLPGHFSTHPTSDQPLAYQVTSCVPVRPSGVSVSAPAR